MSAENKGVSRSVVLQKLISYYQIFGGILGLWECLRMVLYSDTNVLLVLIWIVIFGISIIAGITLLREGNKLGSYFNLSLQVVRLDFFYYLLMPHALLSVSGDGHIGITFELDQSFLINVSSFSLTSVGINIVALAALVYLTRLQTNDDKAQSA